jgi:hypothetical protein
LAAFATHRGNPSAQSSKATLALDIDLGSDRLQLVLQRGINAVLRPSRRVLRVLFVDTNQTSNINVITIFVIALNRVLTLKLLLL